MRFLGYDPARIKLVAYVLAAGMAGLAGALLVVVILFLPKGIAGLVENVRRFAGPRMPQRGGGRPRIAKRAVAATATEEVA